MRSNIFPPHNGKPYWLTEWGFSSTVRTSAQDGSRTRSVQEIKDYLRRLQRQGRLAGAFWYVWNEPDGSSIFREGKVMDAGNAAISPIP